MEGVTASTPGGLPLMVSVISLVGLRGDSRDPEL